MLKSTLTAQIYKFYLNSNEEETIFTLQGNSMYPTLKEGWKVKVKLMDAKEINLGDIVVFSQKELICHRIIGRFRWNKKIYFILKGDAQNIGGVIKEGCIIGNAIAVYDAQGKRIDERLWQRSFDSLIKTKLLGLTYLLLFLIKRFFFGRKQNRLTRLIRKIFWSTYPKWNIEKS